MFARGMELHFRPAFLGEAQVHAGIGEVGVVAVRIACQAALLALTNSLRCALSGQLPARGVNASALEHCVHTVFGFQTMLDHFKLQLPTAPISGLVSSSGSNTCTAPSSPNWRQTFCNCLASSDRAGARD